ncbi:hypothetical protein EVAR_81358_1 [Eumeta japonica]|uniref:Uncharacterized protein n=1 Tax=Eumeta variegata TaxID=151549 RepID=A0A4C1XB70_EUMVA|nr:hypothetical protein EVAR_81358_1 [Eumeta japonica]
MANVSDLVRTLTSALTARDHTIYVVVIDNCNDFKSSRRDIHNDLRTFKVESVQRTYVVTHRVSEKYERLGSTITIYTKILVANFKSCEGKTLEFSFPIAAATAPILLLISASRPSVLDAVIALAVTFVSISLPAPGQCRGSEERNTLVRNEINTEGYAAVE